MTFPRAGRIALVASVGSFMFLGGMGCDLFKKASANKVVILTWLETPKLTIPPFDQDKSLGAVAVTAFFGDQKGAIAEPKPVSGAFAAFFGTGKQYMLTEKDPENAPGLYSQISTDEGSQLVYDADPNHRFGFKACPINTGGCVGEEYLIERIVAAPSADPSTISFTPPLGTTIFPGFSGSAAQGQDLTVTFPPPPESGEQYRPIVNVFGPTGDPSRPVGQLHTSMPTTPPELLKFFTEKPPTALVIPGKAFPAPGPYLVLATTARLNLDTSDNLFLGSGALAGSAAGFIIEIQ